MEAEFKVLAFQDKAEALTRCEGQVERSHVAIGLAFAEIQKGRLWQAKSHYSSFVDYAQRRWGYGRTYAYQLIKTSKETIKRRETTGLNIPNAAVSHALLQVDEDQRDDVLTAAAALANRAGRAVTTTDIKIVKERKTIPLPVMELADTLQWGDDPERLDCLWRWFSSGENNPDSKWSAALRSAVLDCGDEGEPLELRGATLRDIHTMEERWRKMRMSLNNNALVYQGRISVKGVVTIDGQRLHLDGKIVKIVIEG